jgi:hypothetical protein
MTDQRATNERRSGDREDDIHDGDLRDHDLLRMVTSMMDDGPAPVPRDSVERLVEVARQAERRSLSGHRLLRRLAVPAIVATVVVIVVSAVASLLGGLLPSLAPPGTPPHDEPACPVPVALPFVQNPPPARKELLALQARALSLAGGDSRNMYSYVHVQTWALDMTSPTPLRDAVCRDERLWWSHDRSGRLVVSRIRALGVLGESAGTPGVTEYGPGELAVVVDSPADDAAILASQLAEHEDFRRGPVAPLRAVRDLFRYHVLNPQQRAAAARVLAETPGLASLGTAVDPLGRRGIAVAADSDGGSTRDIAIFDPDTAVLLSYQRIALRNATRTTVDTPIVTDAVLFVESGTTRRLGQPPKR